MFEVRADPANAQTAISFGNISKRLRTNIRQALYRVGKRSRVIAKQGILNPPKTGRIYYLRKGPQARLYRHQASAPGQYPATFTGNLQRSITFEVRGALEVVFGSEVYRAGRRVEYAKYLEQGTWKMQPRPFLKLTVEKNKPYVKQQMEQALRMSL